MKNEHLYKKIKYELALNLLYNGNKYHRPKRQTLWSICTYFKVEFNNQRFNVIYDFSFDFSRKILINTNHLFYTEIMFIEYANSHNIRLYDIKEHKIINSV